MSIIKYKPCHAPLKYKYPMEKCDQTKVHATHISEPHKIVMNIVSQLHDITELNHGALWAKILEYLMSNLYS